MTEEEKKEIEDKPEAEMWTMESLTALTDEVQVAEIEFKGKILKYQYCELVESEEPKFKPLSDRASEEQKLAYYTEIGGNRILAMLEKANDKDPEGPCIGKDMWALLPTTLRYGISNAIMGVEQESRENFPF